VSDRYAIVRLDDLDRIDVGAKGLQWRPIRRRLGIRAFGINAYSASHADGEVVEEHNESQLGHEEVYVVVRGHARFQLDDEEVDAPAGTLVYLRDPAARRKATAIDDDTLVLAVGGKPGEAFKPSAWEAAFSAAPLAKDGRYDEAVEAMLAQAKDYPDSAGFLYNLACYEALAGRADVALEHLSRAAELEERFRGYAAEDPDFASLRDDPRFATVLDAREGDGEVSP
jgi:tetratricopeptide (TPR) repeat protein